VQEAGLGVGEVDLSRHLRHGLAVVIAHRTASRGEAPIAGLLAELDAALSAQVREIIDHPQFQQLQSTWRELHRHCEHFAVSS
jgi:predicted component of type VI protein secretion system